LTWEILVADGSAPRSERRRLEATNEECAIRADDSNIVS
jgi:hypothetical protein